MKINDILYYSWGYEQTNVDFFQVVGITKSGKSVLIREIKQDTREDSPFLTTGSCTPIPDSFVTNDPSIQKQIKTYANQEILSMAYGVCRLWDGLPVSYSSYA